MTESSASESVYQTVAVMFGLEMVTLMVFIGSDEDGPD